MEKNLIEIKDLSKDYLDDTGFNVHLLEDVSFSISEGKITTLLAPTGAGKSSLVKIIAGLEKRTFGKIKDNTKNKIFIPSGPSSFPWLNVIDNIKFHLKKIDEHEIQRIINLVGLEGYEDHFPHNKSLGFRFRISLARTLSHNPDLIIIDEPFRKIKNEIKLELYQILKRICLENNKTILFATTNITEAIILSDEIYLLAKNPGRIIEHLTVDKEKVPDNGIFQAEIFHELRNRIEETFEKIQKEYFLDLSI